MKRLLDEYDGATTLHRYKLLVADRILKFSDELILPSWLLEFYKREHSDELLRLLIHYNRLYLAGSVLLNAIEDENDKLYEPKSMRCSMTRYLPYNVIDQLLLAMEEEIEQGATRKPVRLGVDPDASFNSGFHIPEDDEDEDEDEQISMIGRPTSQTRAAVADWKNLDIMLKRICAALDDYFSLLERRTVDLSNAVLDL